MSYPFMRSYVQGGTARGGRRAVVWHMAEGGNTVNFLAGPNNNGVSVHFVIQYDGDIWQMLRMDQMHTSIRITQPSGAHAIRHSDDAPYDWLGEKVVYGQSAAIAVMGDWADVHKSLGPNHASIAVEIEGFAADGPNATQEAAIARLWDDLKGRYPSIRSLCHRDFANYKACPGKKFPWDAAGGHGPVVIAPEVPTDMSLATTGLTLTSSHAIKLPAGTRVYEQPAPSADVAYTVGADPEVVPYFGSVGDYKAVRVDPGTGSRIAYTATGASPFEVRPTAPDCSAAVDAAVAATKAGARITWD